MLTIGSHQSRVIPEKLPFASASRQRPSSLGDRYRPGMISR